MSHLLGRRRISHQSEREKESRNAIHFDLNENKFNIDNKMFSSFVLQNLFRDFSTIFNFFS